MPSGISETALYVGAGLAATEATGITNFTGAIGGSDGDTGGGGGGGPGIPNLNIDLPDTAQGLGPMRVREIIQGTLSGVEIPTRETTGQVSALLESQLAQLQRQNDRLQDELLSQSGMFDGSPLDPEAGLPEWVTGIDIPGGDIDIPGGDGGGGGGGSTQGPGFFEAVTGIRPPDPGGYVVGQGSKVSDAFIRSADIPGRFADRAVPDSGHEYGEVGRVVEDTVNTVTGVVSGGGSDRNGGRTLDDLAAEATGGATNALPGVSGDAGGNGGGIGIRTEKAIEQIKKGETGNITGL